MKLLKLKLAESIYSPGLEGVTVTVTMIETQESGSTVDDGFNRSP